MNSTNLLLQKANQLLKEGDALFEKEVFKDTIISYEKATKSFREGGDRTAYKDSLTRFYPAYLRSPNWDRAIGFLQKEIDDLGGDDKNIDLGLYR